MSRRCLRARVFAGLVVFLVSMATAEGKSTGSRRRENLTPEPLPYHPPRTLETISFAHPSSRGLSHSVRSRSPSSTARSVCVFGIVKGRHHHQRHPNRTMPFDSAKHRISKKESSNRYSSISRNHHRQSALSRSIMSTPQDRPRSAGQVKLTRGHSCVACHQRKVKCDGKRPCSTCVKSSRAADCRSARPASNRQAVVTDQTLLLRLRRYEHLLIANGIPLNGQPGEEEGTPSRDAMETDADDGHIIIQRGHPRFVENVIWNRLGNELAEDLSELNEAGEAEISEDEDAVTPDNLIFGKPTMNNMSHLAPGVPQILRLWQAFLDNFNPLVKLFHAPTIQQVISDAVADPQRLNPSTEALLFSIYLCGATTLTNQECLTQLGESKQDLLRRFSAATQQSLVNAQFLKSTDVVVLQALTLYLLARRRYMNEQSIWLLAGLASRLAQTMGLHREHSLQRLSPFEAEIRRRLWWQIVILDNRSAQVSGTMADGIFNDSGYTRRPLNVSDSDLSPFMGELPSEYDGPTEMLFCTIRFEVGEVMRQLTAVEKACKSNHATCMTQKEQVIDAFETKIEYLLKRCDPSIPLHLMSMLLGRSAVCQTRLSIWQTKYDNTKSVPQAERDDMFRLALKSLEYDSLTYSTKSLQPYLWHVVNNFPFQAFIHLLTDLFHRTQPEEINLAWTAINQAYEDHPELISDVHSPLCFAVGNLTLKAWEHQAAAPSPQSPMRGGGVPPLVSPAVAKLQAQRPSRTPKSGQSPNATFDGARKNLQLVDQKPFALAPGSADLGNLEMAQYLLSDDADMMWGSWQSLNL